MSSPCYQDTNQLHWPAMFTHEASVAGRPLNLVPTHTDITTIIQTYTNVQVAIIMSEVGKIYLSIHLVYSGIEESLFLTAHM